MTPFCPSCRLSTDVKDPYVCKRCGIDVDEMGLEIKPKSVTRPQKKALIKSKKASKKSRR